MPAANRISQAVIEANHNLYKLPRVRQYHIPRVNRYKEYNG